MRRELNPNHAVTREIREQWHKLCAIVMLRQGLTEVEITAADIERLTESGTANIVVDTRGKRLFLRLVSDAEGERLARQEGGLPV